MREKTLEKCSTVCTLSKNKKLNSLNVSVDAGVILFEIALEQIEREKLTNKTGETYAIWKVI